MNASPHIITYDPVEPPAEFSPTIGTFGWGLGWYPPDDKGAAVLKDPTRASNNQMKELLSQWERFRSTIFVGHLRGAAMRIAQEDTHPISRIYAGKEFLIVHNGQLSDDFREKLSIEQCPEFQPVGMTDTEHVLCWILMRMRQGGFSSFKETGYVQLHTWLSEVDELGSLNLMLSDGQDLILHQDRNGFHPLYYIRKKPPHAKTFIETSELSLKLPLPQDQNCTALVFASKPSSSEAWTQMSLGQTMVCCKAQVIWDSHFAMSLSFNILHVYTREIYRP
jgi:predicted glutamine amidotransferase